MRVGEQLAPAGASPIPPARSLHWRMQMILAVTFATALIVVLWAINWEMETTLMRVVQDRARGGAAQVAGLIGPPSLIGLRQLQQAADQTPVFREYLKDRSAVAAETMRAALRSLVTTPPRRIALWPDDGQGVIEVSLVAPAAHQGAPRELPAAGLRPSHSGIGLFQGVSAGTIVVDLVADVTEPGPASKHLGFVVVRAVVTLNPPGIVGRLIGADARVSMGNQNGTSWFDLSDFGAVATPVIDVSRDASVDFAEADGKRFIGALHVVPDTPWAVMVAFPRSIVVSPTRSTIARAAMLGLVFAVAGAVAVWTLTRTITGPLASLTAAAEAVAAGDYSRRVRPVRGDEIGRLGHAFDSMTMKVAEGYHELESRVQERTEALNEAVAVLRQRSEAQQAYLAAIVESTGDAVIGQSLGGSIQSCNRAAEWLYGYSASELIGQHVTTLMPTELQQEATTLLESIRSGEYVRDYETVHLKKDGTRIPVSITMSPIIDASSGVAVGLAAIARDITARKALEEQLRHAQKMEAIGQLAGGIAHDFNNMLTAILGFSRFVFESLPVDDDRRFDLEQVINAAERAARLTRQLLAFSRKQVVQPVAVNLNDAVTETSKMLRRLIGEHVDVDLCLSPDLGLVRVDPGQLDQILVNLVTNAQDAMPTGGGLTIETANVDLDESFTSRHGPVRRGPYVMLAVTDSGTGMTAETRARLFEPFFTTKERGKGTGLGLATVYAVVQQSGGYLYVYSELGHGSTFKIYLPRAEAAAEAGAPAAIGGAPAPGGSETVLLVEDEQAVRVLTHAMLEEAGYRVIEADNPESAETAFAGGRARVDLLLTDVVMPGASGPALYQRLRTAHPELRVVYMSGYPDDALFRAGRLESGTAYLQKPFTADALRRKLREVLDASHCGDIPA